MVVADPYVVHVPPSAVSEQAVVAAQIFEHDPSARGETSHSAFLHVDIREKSSQEPVVVAVEYEVQVFPSAVTEQPPRVIQAASQTG